MASDSLESDKRLRRCFFTGLRTLAYFLVLPLVVLVQLLQKRRGEMLLWGPVPIINNKYWSAAMAQMGWNSKTLMTDYYASINRREDFDLYFEDLASWVPFSRLKTFFGPLIAHLYVTRNAKVAHIPFSGGPLGSTPLWRAEAPLYRLSGVKTVVIPYGADVYVYSRIPDPSVRHVLMTSYPARAREEHSVARRISYWSRHADVIVIGYTLEGIGRWDVPAGNMVCIDTSLWSARSTYSNADGKNGKVKVVHAPNHRGAKGTEFLLQAVEYLVQEGLDVELVLLERTQNEEVRERMQDADIVADQFVLPGHGLGAIEGMACGLPVMSNLSLDAYTRVFRRYSYLNECPILATTPENLVDNLRLLVRNFRLRQELGKAGREYVEKYHSYATAQYLFGSIYDKLLRGKDVDLMNLFHPLKSPFNRAKSKVNHPLAENRLPADYPREC